MRYIKESTVITPADVALLCQVRNARFVGHQQLFDLLQHDSQIFSRSSFNWRVQRLLKCGFIERLREAWWQGSAIYSITAGGLVELEAQGEFLIAVNSGSKQTPNPAHIHHALELNAVRLALAKRGLLAHWESDVEISSRNMVSGSYSKDYDAVVKIWFRGQMVEFALEYERTLKNAKQYEKIRRALEEERTVRCVLYLTTNPDLVLALLHHLTPLNLKIGFTTAKSFREQMLAASVTLAANSGFTTVEEFLQ
jgi:hypothetical protein